MAVTTPSVLEKSAGGIVEWGDVPHTTIISLRLLDEKFEEIAFPQGKDNAPYRQVGQLITHGWSSAYFNANNEYPRGKLVVGKPLYTPRPHSDVERLPNEVQERIASVAEDTRQNHSTGELQRTGLPTLLAFLTGHNPALVVFPRGTRGIDYLNDAADALSNGNERDNFEVTGQSVLTRDELTALNGLYKYLAGASKELIEA